MKNFRFYNLIAGWLIFLVAAITYLLTMEPTSSFWDCGEFIATAYKLEVGHPPGAPFFMILGRFFTLFAGGNELAVAASMNALSALASAFTILFLFWTITHLVRKFYDNNRPYSASELVTILGAGALGALAYTFSDTFWFSAVEAEVYAMSSLFTAFVFWAMLKWENIADEPNANRWLILIAFVMGISIGTHLLNLLAIPALVFVFYFRKFKFSTRGLLAALGVSLLLLGFVLEVIIAGIPFFASKFELMFVNGLKLPYFSGVAIYLILLFGLVIYGIYYTRKKAKVLWNTLLLAVFVLMIGYSSYAVIVIRSVANTPLDESNPETIFSLQSYLNREQYGDRPLFHGAYFNAVPESVEPGSPAYYRGEGGYDEVSRDRNYVYNSRFEGFFPRMWSSQGKHTNEYIYWGKLRESDLYNVRTDANGQPVLNRMGNIRYDRNSPKRKPDFSENLKFFFRYQVGYMYMRYFMWNFAGRQNDMQGHGELHKGNWLSGIKFIDEARLGPQDDLPDSIRSNRAYNRYYMLPLIFGLVGMIFHFRRKTVDAWIVALLFILTGLAVVVYLNQYPLQPRERDYAYAGSFYAFSIWIGLGVVGIIEFIQKKVRSFAVPVVSVLAALVFVPGIMAKENWDDHDRSGRYTTTAFARNYLNSCDENAIIFTNGDNDTFPLWYIQEVEGYRTDVRVVNLSYLTADWYIEQMTFKFYESEPLPLSMTIKQYRQGTRDYAYLVETATALIGQKYLVNEDKYEDDVMQLFNDALLLVQRSRLPSGYPNDYKAFIDLRDRMDPMRLYSYLRTFQNEDVAEKIGMDQQALRAVVSDLEALVKTIDTDAAPLKDAINFLASEDPRFENNRYFIPARKFVVPVDTAGLPAAIKTGTVAKNLVNEVRFRLTDEVIYKNTIAQLDMLATNNWERPIYFSNTVSNEYFLNLDNTFIQEGLAYRIAPIDVQSSAIFGMIDTDRMYKRLIDEFEWGGIDDPDIYLDENNIRMTIKYRYAFASLARALAEEGENEKAIKVLDYCMEHMPHDRVPFNFSVVPIIQSYYVANAVEKAVALTEKMESVSTGELDYYTSVILANPAKSEKMRTDFLQVMRDLNSMSSIAVGFGETDLSRKIQEEVDSYVEIFEQYFSR
ncbi:MAG: DUF2723 domain-containing protein [Bacteroidales bacterium]|nr:DUF2723 domain-containing protein [Bacteroidales bacterium]